MTGESSSHLDDHGDEAGRSQDLLAALYSELRQLAAKKIANERPGHSLQATALVHEAYLRLVNGSSDAVWGSRSHFFSAAAETMERILVESARRKKRIKHGGEHQIVGLDNLEISSPSGEDLALHEDVLQLNEALIKLEQSDTAAAQIVRLRYFTGLTIRESAEILNISNRSADRLWSYARAWLKREMETFSE